jgi:paraquat-inducible protein A
VDDLKTKFFSKLFSHPFQAGKHYIYFMKNNLRYSLLVLHIGSIVLMIFGWVLPIISMDIFADVPIIGKYYFLQETRSVFGTLEKLFENGNWFPALLILLFGIIVPVTKTICIFLILFSNKVSAKMKQFIASISKWAMADVFAMGILIAFLAANSLGQTQANFHSGFYCFAAYCIISIFVTQVVVKKEPIL